MCDISLEIDNPSTIHYYELKPWASNASNTTKNEGIASELLKPLVRKFILLLFHV